MILKLILLMVFSLMPNIAFGYIGLGPVLPLLGSVIAYGILTIIAIFGFLTYPIMVIYKKYTNKKNNLHNKNSKTP